MRIEKKIAVNTWGAAECGFRLSGVASVTGIQTGRGSVMAGAVLVQCVIRKLQ